jgi:fibro-slime domain-containing protein
VLGPRPVQNYGIAYWFRPWADSAQGIFTKPTYSNNGMTFNSWQAVNHDTAFINRVFKDSLAFRYVPASAGIYQFQSGSFFRLDNRGFGTEPSGSGHNFAFTMELHWKFTKQANMTFNFSGDDDVWAFVNNQLVMDLGGVHGSAAGSFRVDDIPGLLIGKEYDFDLFYCERHTSASTILITTNVITSQPNALHIQVKPSTTIRAGDTLYGFAEVRDQNDSLIPRSALSGVFNWGFVDLHANNAPSTLWRISDTLSLHDALPICWKRVLPGPVLGPDWGRRRR